jgi:16S rRNA (uracil1498-N3)-methyltransferase
VTLPFFLVEALPAGPAYTLDGPEGHHAAAAQRLRPGERLVLADGRGSTADAVVTAAGRGHLELRIESRRYARPPAPRLVVVQAIAKGDRGELAVQAMTEIGVDEIVPWAAARSIVQWRGERGVRARHRWLATVREAAKQARRAWLPQLAPVASTTEVVRRVAGAATTLVLHEEATARLSTSDINRAGDVLLVVGPEGGIEPAELEAFTGAGAAVVRLGETVLRTSTAGAAALAVLSARLGRW